MPIGFGPADIDKHSDHLVAYWRLEETGAADRVDNVGANDLTAVNTPATRAGINNLACDFDIGSLEYLIRVDTADLSPTTGFAISSWLYCDNASTRRFVYDKSFSYYMFVQGALIYAYMHEADNDQKTINATFNTGQWVHVVHIAANGFLRLYLDGTEVGTPAAYDNTVLDNAEPFILGGGPAADPRHFDGGIDEVGFWKNITFADQTERDAFVTALYNYGVGRFYGEIFVPRVIAI